MRRKNNKAVLRDQNSQNDFDFEDVDEDEEVLVPQTESAAKSAEKLEDQILISDQDVYTSKCEEYQVSLKILEAKQLSGLDIDPSVTVKVGNDQKKSTKTKKSTNDPVYDEHFIFDFTQPPAVFFDQMITLEAIHTTRILRRKLLIGSFKIDIGTVFRQPNRMFFHKWALLLDPLDPISGSKGYIKCDIAVFRKGEIIKMPAGAAGENDEIEANILMPEDVGENVVLERDPARYVLGIHRAEGLPSVRAGVMSNVRKAITGNAPIDLVDSYVQVSFAGQTVSFSGSSINYVTQFENVKGKTKVKKDSSNPDWSQQIMFTELFPSLVRTMRIHVRDHNGTVIATTFLDMNVIADNSTEGFMPTFGPAWVNLYGSYRNDNQVTPMNFGLGEGVSFRGRLLLSLRVEVEENLTKSGLQNVTVKNALPLSQACTGKKEEYFLFCSILNASMINKKLAGKPLYFELSVGNCGNELDGFKPIGLPDDKEKSMSRSGSKKSLDKEIDEDEAALEEQNRLLAQGKGKGGIWRSKTEPMKPTSSDSYFCYLPINGKKPCMHIYSEWEDQRVRMFHVNCLNRMNNAFESMLTDVVRLVEMEQFRVAIRKLKYTLDNLSSQCNEYLSFLETSDMEYSPYLTPLDKLKVEQRKREIKNTCRLISKLRLRMTKVNIVNKLKEAYSYADKLRMLSQEVPGVTQDENEDWAIWAQVTAYFWMGLSREIGTYLEGLPRKFKQQDVTIKNPALPDYVPPTHILYKESHAYELRCHLFQGRSLTPADESGLSDPFIRFLFEGDALQSEICFQTVNPVWDQCLVIPVKKLFGLPSAIVKSPPQVVLQAYDYDDVGENELIGQAEVFPMVKLANERYDAPKFPPSLNWIPLYKGKYRVGEILACFELIQLAFDEAEERGDGIVPVPKTIRPTLSAYRLGVLFWGVRDLSSPGMMAVDKPKVEVEVGNNVLQSAVIPSFKKQQNFPDMIKYMDVMLPDDPLYRPPVTIRCLDSRTFGRSVLVGTHIINSIDAYMYEALSKGFEDDEAPLTNSEEDILTDDVMGSESDFEGPPPPSMAELDFYQKHYEQSMSSSSEEEDIDGFIPPKFDEDLSTLPDNGSVKTASSVKGGLVVPHSKGPSSVRSAASSVKSGISAAGEEKKKKLEAIEEEDAEDKDDAQLGSTKPLASISPTPQKGEGAEGKAGKKKKKGQTPASEVKFDWWSKYYASVQDREEEKAKLAKKIRRRHKKKSKKMKARLLQGLNRAWNAIYDLKEKTLNKKRREEEKKRRAMMDVPTDIQTEAEASLNKAMIARLTLYDTELESVSEFSGFRDTVQSFKLLRGKKTFSELDEKNRLVGTFKGNLALCALPLPKQLEDSGFFERLPSSEPTKFTVRVYVIKVSNLHPADTSGRADPYLKVSLGKKKFNDKSNRIHNQLNPTFGRTGYNQWRDIKRPSQILAQLCKKYELRGPYYKPGQVTVGAKTFTPPRPGQVKRVGSKSFSAMKVGSKPDKMEKEPGKMSAEVLDSENVALYALHHWNEYPGGFPLLPEYVETRTLYHPEQPGVDQGSVELWVDMFQKGAGGMPGPIVNVVPRKPKKYELRVTIWNTKNVILDDTGLTGTDSVDQYVKGYIIGPEVDCQQTDVHYRSLKGEGMFNWRFIFRLEYLDAEEKLVYRTKASIFSLVEHEEKIPVKLSMQVWDADTFSADDYLGTMVLDLNRIPRGAKSAATCAVSMMDTENNTGKTVNLFQLKRMRGWWPFIQYDREGNAKLAGKADIELQLVTSEDAEKRPVGLGRAAPEPVTEPQRPETSFAWYKNPLKMMYYDLWMGLRYKCLVALIILLLLLFVGAFVYQLPSSVADKIISG